MHEMGPRKPNPTTTLPAKHNTTSRPDIYFMNFKIVIHEEGVDH